MKQAAIYRGAVVVAIGLYKCACLDSERQQHIASISSSSSDMMQRYTCARHMGGRRAGDLPAAAATDLVTVKSDHVVSVCGERR